MQNELYNKMKNLASASPLPCAILSVEKTDEQKIGEISYLCVNEPFKLSFYCQLQNINIDAHSIDYSTFDEYLRGKSYTCFIPREPKFDKIAYECAWNNEPTRVYVDTTKTLSCWSEFILMPINCEHDDNISYCQFFYIMDKQMNPSKYSLMSPDISQFVIQSCLELNEDRDFIESLNHVTKEIREYTNSFTCSMISIDRQSKDFSILSESVLNNMFSVKEIFKDFPFEIMDAWSQLFTETNSLIIKDAQDMEIYEKKAPAWVSTLKRDNVSSLCLVPLTHHNETIGYLYIANFDISETSRVKETMELLAHFLSSELANYQASKK
ncbi:hypothetical protein SAMN02910384_01230 [Pseudobutyrivibrio sp. ACV-2]|uniref:GAF domain-containing protein n=1 Tax=Pseudobutyrivibrio sp. ACV-2 TaxID=1520801 RepID=UPI00089A40FC|nr:GAF domain-containing protein [Pseudobutyrivibrio sp. ACV-2]SEA29636.1 hypothetical protein SAMN02910384_01230 [Pseudobutyrivibrio sp. ACV-2]